MATSAYVSTAETTHANRISRVILGPCADQLREVLRHHIPLPRFQHCIRKHKFKLPRLTKPQLDLIFQRNGHYSGNYSDMDISLLYLLLRNICNIPPHTTGWGKCPDPTDLSLSASIERIREVRNALGHSSSSSLSQSHFNDLWSYIKGAVHSIDSFLQNGMKYTNEMDLLLTETMDPEQEQFYLDMLKEEVKEDTQTREMLKAVEETVHESVTRLQRLDHHAQQIDCKMQSMENRSHGLDTLAQKHDAEIADIRSKIEETRGLSDENHDVNQLKQRLIEENEYQAQEISISPIQESGDKLPIEQLFSSVVIKEDFKESRKQKKSATEEGQEIKKEVKTPYDLLIKNGKHVSRVYMLGDAAHGKTTYCLWLVKTWCNTQRPGIRQLNEWELALSQFDFVFYLPLHHVDPSRSNVTDMICHDVFEMDTSLQSSAKHVLSGHEYRCLIIMDGLDEWNPEEATMARLKYKGFPNIDSIFNSVIFTTMRPWSFSDVARLVRNTDRVIEIQGLDDKSIETVIKKVLEHYYEIKPDTAEYEEKYKEMVGKLKDKTVRSFIKIPLLAVVCVQIWYEGRQVGGSLTSFYALMTDMLIERALAKVKRLVAEDKEIKYSLPDILLQNENIMSYLSILLKLGEVAFNGLLSDNDSLEFQKRKLEKDIGKKELQFVLEVGLISQREAPSLTTRNVKVRFFHKSIQEFLAALYICTNKDASDLFLDHLSNVKVIMELSYVIIFICGMRPFLGSLLSQHVVCVTDSDQDICKYRELLFEYSSVKELYKLQLSWFRELHYGQTDGPVKFHVSDIYLHHSDTGIEEVRMTKELMAYHFDEIRSLWLLQVPTRGEHGISNKELNDFLSDIHKMRSLVMVYISGYDTDRSLNSIVGPKLRYLHLYGVEVQIGVGQPFIECMDMLQVLNIDDVTLDDRDLGLSFSMSQLRQITLVRINMTMSGWVRLIKALIDINNQIIVTLVETNMDDSCQSRIRRTRCFSVTQCDMFEVVFEKKMIA